MSYQLCPAGPRAPLVDDISISPRLTTHWSSFQHTLQAKEEKTQAESDKKLSQTPRGTGAAWLRYVVTYYETMFR